MGATYGTLTIRGVSGRVWNTECYLPDAAAGLWGFSLTGKAAATARTTLTIPESGWITGFVLTTAPTATGAEIMLDSMNVTGGTIRFEVNTTASATVRCPIAIPVKAGQLLSVLNF